MQIMDVSVCYPNPMQSIQATKSVFQQRLIPVPGSCDQNNTPVRKISMGGEGKDMSAVQGL